jgi:hypothetical protein
MYPIANTPTSHDASNGKWELLQSAVANYCIVVFVIDSNATQQY